MKIFFKINFNWFDNLGVIAGSWIDIRKYRLILFSLVAIILLVFSYTPYTNLLINLTLVIFLSVLMAPFMLDLDEKLYFGVIIFLLFLVLFLYVTNQREEAELVSQLIYILFLSGSLRAIFSY